MADTYVDFEQTASTSTSPYDTWAKAAADIQTGLTQAGAGGRCFVRVDGDDVAATKDTVAGARTLSWPGTSVNPSVIYGVKNGTTAEPPTDSDLCVRGTDTLPVYESTSSGNISFDDVANANTQATANGIRFDSGNNIVINVKMMGLFSDCEWKYSIWFLNAGSTFRLTNVEHIFTNTGGGIQATGNADLIGGLFSGAVPDPVFTGVVRGVMRAYGVDMSLITGALFNFGSQDIKSALLINCKMATGFTRTVNNSNTAASFIELIGSTDETGLGSGESVRDYAKEWPIGTVLSEATIIRTDGSNDGVASFSYSLTPKAATTKESLLSIWTPWFGGRIEGDASTSKDFTIYIANDTGSDLTKADVWVEILYPSETGITQHGSDISSRTIIDASAADVDDDTVSDWSTGAGGKNAQKIVISKTPDYTGLVYARVHFAQRGTNTLYVDPKVYVTDT